VVCNFSKPTADKPALLSFNELETFMHEMGHAIHGMLSDIHYPSLSGTSVLRDFVEMPSQVMENWCYETDFLNTFARHYLTGAPMPEEYIDKIRRSKNFQAGWLCLRQLNFGAVDMAFHTLVEPMDGNVRVEDFEHSAMTELLPPIEGCCTSTAFTHIFAGGYAAGYYGYKWAEVLDADIFSKFKAEGIFNSGTAKEFRDRILSRGGSSHPADLFRGFMHRDPDPDALMRRCGFI
jgi:peptidyl-dipeptidase Dcp